MKIIFLNIAILLMLSPLYSQNKPVLHTELDSIVNEMKDSISQINKRVNNADETYEIAKKYSETADKLINLYFTIFGGIFVLFGGSLIGFYFWTTRRYKKILEKQYIVFKKEVIRLLKTERDTKAIKKNAKLLFLFKKDMLDSNIEFNEMLNTILKEFESKNILKAYTNDVSQIDDENYKSFLTDKTPLKVVITNDQLFEGLSEEEVKSKASKLFTILNEKSIGFALFGNKRFGKTSHKYKAYSNEPYSFYTNLNNLLKYMVVAKDIKF